MKYQEKEFILKNGSTCILRSPDGKDAEGILDNLRQTSGETDYMARYEDEINMTVEQEESFLDALIEDPKSIMISAIMDGEIVANAGFSSLAPYEKYRHRAEFGISIKKKCWNLGIGSLLLSAIVDTAGISGYEQIELEVVAENTRALALYHKFGFSIYGTREKSFKLRDGSYTAEHLMILFLQDSVKENNRGCGTL